MKPDDSEELRRFLKMLDDSEAVSVSDWEAQFIESFLTNPRPLTPKQREVADALREKYLPRM